MQTLESLRKKIGSAEELKSVVRTMKALAAVNIRQYEKAVESLSEYNRTTQLGLQVVLREGLLEQPMVRSFESGHFGAVIFGSQQGLSGQFNDQISSYAVEEMLTLKVQRKDARVMALGDRLVPELEERQLTPHKLFPLPSSVAGITSAVWEVLVEIENWRIEEQLERIVLFYHRQLSGASYEPQTVYLFPIDPEWFKRWEMGGWPSRTLPAFSMNRGELLSSLLRQHLFASLYRAFAESLASENASRLSAMHAAEKNITESLEELTKQFHLERQTSITSELLDIVSGFEALEPTKASF